MNNDYMNFLWEERFRPVKVEECILPVKIKQYFFDMINGGDLQNLLLCGNSGLGKTTVAKALCNDLGLEFDFINASDENGIDVLRNRITKFASTSSFNGNIKVVILDEADNLNANSTQRALRSFIEEYSSNCRFILTANEKHKIIPALQSRLNVIDFFISDDEVADIGFQIYTRLEEILMAHDIKYSDDVLYRLVEKYFPDFRKIIQQAQRFSMSGELTVNVLSAISEETVNEVVGYLKKKDWKSCREWVANHYTEDSNIYRKVYDALEQMTSDVGTLVMITQKYQYESVTHIDEEINLITFLTELMDNIAIKNV